MDRRYFYQAIDLPKVGFVPGTWDHRGAENVYLGHTDFSGLSALDVGPANGFWSFAMERRGAKVIALELGSSDEWDAVPHGGRVSSQLIAQLHQSVAAVHADLLFCRDALKSKIQIKRGSAYHAASSVDQVDVAMMGNILQHLRDPFLAIERVCCVVKKRIIISESIWTGDDDFLNTASMRLITRAETPQVNHSWFQMTPVLVMEILKILGFGNLKCEIHEQLFNGYTKCRDGQAQKIKHFTISADRI
jgi:hypothetical protein